MPVDEKFCFNTSLRRVEYSRRERLILTFGSYSPYNLTPPPLYQVSRQVRAESLPIFYGYYNFITLHPRRVVDLLRARYDGDAPVDPFLGFDYSPAGGEAGATHRAAGGHLATYNGERNHFARTERTHTMESGFVRISNMADPEPPPAPVPFPIKIVTEPPPADDSPGGLDLPPAGKGNDQVYSAWGRSLAREPKRATKTYRATHEIEAEKEAVKQSPGDGLQIQENAAKSFEEAATDCKTKLAAVVEEITNGDCWFLPALMAGFTKKELTDRLCVARNEQVDWDVDKKEGQGVRHDSDKLKASLQKGGTTGGHAYAVLEAWEESDLKLLKLKNPWGEVEREGTELRMDY
ncbi:hypothetical protein DOTSEDRAFT_54670 [Dothistroma septosporum NZE10]|uniref:Calpain catalytic domain-containing protein n=1 Tax=Dothistroma septosporum (strain NZE10 / CBS 128990) TaxID=675120 RepID=N1PJG1_DOTSN|nr:hypothetical protein DOTSEDRAFT_54670 [Dothistroma septosporum NZE10]